MIRAEAFPESGLRSGLLVGRVWQAEPKAGPTVALFSEDGVYDLSHIAVTMSALLEQLNLGQLRSRVARSPRLCSIPDLLESTRRAYRGESTTAPQLLSPCDLQPIKACGVTFAVSAFERVVEERAHGDPSAAARIRESLQAGLSATLRDIRPGSAAAGQLKERMLSEGMWSQYLEVAFGPDAEVFTKAVPMSAVGWGAGVGIHRASAWNNPEPEVVLAVNSRGETVGAALGNDVNLRDVEGRSALLLGKAKDNNGSCAIGPAIRLFDDSFTLDDVRAADVTLSVDGTDGFHLDAVSCMSQISRDPLDLVRQTIGPHHQYPDGLMLFLGTLFAPTQDRGERGHGFTHQVGDIVTIGTPSLGSLMNRVDYSDAIRPWTFGVSQLIKNLHLRGLLVER